MSLDKARISYSIPEAASATGLSQDTVRAAIRLKDLVAHYIGAKRVIRTADLDAWIENAPTERKKSA